MLMKPNFEWNKLMKGLEQWNAHYSMHVSLFQTFGDFEHCASVDTDVCESVVDVDR